MSEDNSFLSLDGEFLLSIPTKACGNPRKSQFAVHVEKRFTMAQDDLICNHCFKGCECDECAGNHGCLLNVEDKQIYVKADVSRKGTNNYRKAEQCQSTLPQCKVRGGVFHCH